MVVRIDAIVLFVKNIDLLKAFYVDLLGLEILEETNSKWVLLNAGNCNIGLHKIGDAFLDNDQEASTFDTNTKIIFEIQGDIYLFRETLVSKNIKLKEVMTWDNYPYLVCDGEDPEGNVFQLQAKKN